MTVTTAGSGAAHVLISAKERKLQEGVPLISVGLMTTAKAERHIIHSIPHLSAIKSTLERVSNPM